MKTETPPTHVQALAKLRELVTDVRTAMLTTVTSEGRLRSRPMVTQQVDIEDAEIWFFTADDAPKVNEIFHEQQVGLAYSCPEKQTYVSISGRAYVIRDPARAKELWTPLAKAWFPQGPSDPRLALLRVEVEQAEYWDSPSSKMVQLYALAKSAITGKPPAELGENVKVNLP